MDKSNNEVLKVQDLNKYYGPNHVLKDINFSMNEGEVIAVIGSSGGGKSTLLRCLTFLEKIDRGSIFIGDEEVIKQENKKVKTRFKLVYKQRIPIEKEVNGEVQKTYKNKYKFFCKYYPTDSRGNKLDEINASIYPSDKILREKALKMGLVFQDFNLFPHKTVLENLILAPMLVNKLSKEDALNIAKAQLKRVGLSEKANAYPCEISGGQKQRVAIARALCMSPEILCFDEPTSALDPELTGEVLKVIKDLKKDNTTMIIVTHEMNFARNVADRIIFIADGIIEEMGAAEQLFTNPKSEKLKSFLSNYNKEE